MDTTYKPTYPCKVISAFFNNYYHQHRYDLIKQITYRKLEIKTDVEKEIYQYFKLFNLAFSIYFQSPIADYLLAYKEVYNENISDEALAILPEMDFKDLVLFIWMNQLLTKIENFHKSEAYFMFLLLTILVNKQYGYSCIPPVDLFTVSNRMQKKEIREYFLFSYFNSLFYVERQELKSEFINFVLENKTDFNNLGIKELYLFGSVMKNEYHEFSDFDILVKYDDIPFENMKNTEKKLSNILFDKFKRQVDIQEYKSFLEYHSLNEVEKIY